MNGASKCYPQIAQIVSFMSESVIIIIAILLASSGTVLYLYVQKSKRGKVISDLTSSMNILAKWTYTPVEWRKAVEEEFTWASNQDIAGQVFISPVAFCVRTNNRDHLVELADKGKVVTHASYRGTSDSPLKLRVRWREVTHDADSGREVNYYKEDYRIPVPSGAKDAARKVVDFFATQIENNQVAYANLVSDDEPISLFGRDDSF